ncbi:MAG: BMP family protein [Anaerolineales bacterium]|nr:BMP family protein [Anaerolineales bacterium]MDW8447181.1 BMP family protein [Anaerolineales bacterium]
MKPRFLIVLLSAIALLLLVLSACQQPPATPEKVIETVTVVETVMVEPEKVVETVVVEKPAEDPLAAAREFLKGKKICAVLPGPVNDAGWTTTAYNALVNLRDNWGMEIAYREETKVEEAEAVLREFAEAGCHIVYAHGFEYFDAINAVAKEYPDIQFLQTSRCTGQEPNVVGVCFSTGEGGYFVGLKMAALTKTGKTAFVVGQSFPQIEWSVEMARQAFKDSGKEGQVDLVAVGSWNDPAKAKELTKALVEQGYDVFVLLADAGDIGTVEALKEAREAGKEVWGISWVKDKNYLAPNIVLGGWEERVWKQIENAAVAYAQNGKPLGKGMPQGVVDEVVTLNPSYGLLPEDVEKQIFDLFNRYKQEGQKVIPNLVVRTDL